MSQIISAGLDELFDYKNRLMQDLLTNEAIVRMLSENLELAADVKSLIYSQVFPYEYLPNTVEHGTTFLCCEVDIDDVVNKTFLVPSLHIWAYTHISLLRLPNGEGVRTDKMASEIDKILNGNRFYGLGELNLRRARRFSPIEHYQGRMLTYRARDYNRLSPTGQPVPSSRKEAK